MTKPGFVQKLARVLGILSVVFFVYFLIILPMLQVKMVRFESLTAVEEAMITSLGVGLLVFLAFYLLLLLQIILYIKHAEKISVFSLALIIASVLCILFVFADWALLSDIHKQYLHQLSQPEWSLIYPILAVQLLLTLLFLYLHFANFFSQRDIPEVARDSNAFLLVQYVGVLTGFLGLLNQGLGLFISRGWNFVIHTLLGSLVLLFPYIVVLFYWAVTKLKETDRTWFDEKQQMDLGRSAIFALIFDIVLMGLIYFLNINQLDGIIRLIWFPLHLFSIIASFSLGNLYFSKRA